MALANRQKSNAKPRWITRRLVRPEFAAALLLTGLLIWLTYWLMGHGYISGPALTQYNWQRVATSTHNLGAYLVLIYPPVPTALGLLLSWIPGVAPVFAPYLLQILCCVVLLSAAWQDIARGQGRWVALLMVGLVLIQPIFLWIATSGYLALELLMLYALCRSMQRLEDEPDVHTLLRIGAVLFVMFLTNAHAGLFLLILVPALLLVAPREIIKRSPVAFHLICYVPVVFLVLCWCYVNWLYTGDLLAPFRISTSLLQDIRQSVTDLTPSALSSWWWYNPLYVIVGGLIAFPTLLMVPTIRSSIIQRALAVLLIVVVGTALIDNWLHGQTLPIEFIALLLAPLLVALRSVRPRWLAVILLMVGLPGGWLIIERQSTSVVVEEWRDTLMGRPTEMFRDETQLCHWLTEHPKPTVVDDVHAYPMIANCQDAAQLITPADDAFQTLISPRLTAERIVVIDPYVTRGRPDRLTRRYPSLWSTGYPGYHFVHEQGSYRIWERDASSEPSAPLPLH